MKKTDHLSEADRAVFEAWVEKFWMFIEDKGDALHIWQAATDHTAARCAAIGDKVAPAAGDAIRAAYPAD